MALLSENIAIPSRQNSALRPPKTLFAANRFGQYCVPASSQHRPAARAILAGDVWEPKTIDFLTSRCGNGDVIHAGTYFGDFLPALSAAIAPGARVWAFEPSAENFQCAEITLKLNDIRNVELAQAALGACAGTALLYTGQAGKLPRGGASTIRATREPGGAYEEVTVVAIDNVVPEDRNVSILQLDVERYEEQALAGGLSVIRRCLPLLVLENLPANRKWFRENVLSLGYRRTGRVDKNVAFTARKNAARG
jgi:FkbM family methyltransferase